MKKGEITFTDFQKLDLRVGEVLNAEAVENSQNLIRLKVDFGLDNQIRTILAGLAKWYKPKDLKGKKFIFAANLAPKKMMNEESQGMILVAENGEDISLIPIKKNIPAGSMVR